MLPEIPSLQKITKQVDEFGNGEFEDSQRRQV